jgi:hypothetical protein
MSDVGSAPVRKAKRPRRGSTKYGLLFVAALVPSILFSAYGSTVVNFNYDRDVGGHVVNAYEVNTPEAMIAELNLTVAGMRRLGLTEGMYSAFFPWERTPDRSMGFQYQFLDQLINRTEAVILWRTLAYNGNSTPETLGDVYEQKMDNLRTFMTEGCSDGSISVCTDWIARDVYFLHVATPYYFAGLFYTVSTFTVTMSIAVFLYVRLAEHGIRKDRTGGLARVFGMETTIIRRYIIAPLYALGFLAMALPFVLPAIA